MSSSEARATWRETRTQYIIDFCKQYGMTVLPLNNGYQLRVENLVDFYPTNGRYCILQSGERGGWHRAKDLRDIMLKAIPGGESPFGPLQEVTVAEQTLTLDPVFFKPPTYQKTVMDNIIKRGLPLPSQRFGRHPYSVGIDVSSEDGDKTVIAKGYKGHNGKVTMVFDEYSEWPHYNWYRNPIKWYKFNKLMSEIARKRK